MIEMITKFREKSADSLMFSTLMVVVHENVLYVLCRTLGEKHCSFCNSLIVHASFRARYCGETPINRGTVSRVSKNLLPILSLTALTVFFGKR